MAHPSQQTQSLAVSWNDLNTELETHTEELKGPFRKDPPRASGFRKYVRTYEEVACVLCTGGEEGGFLGGESGVRGWECGTEGGSPTHYLQERSV